MDTYSLLREIADSWVLLALVIFFLATVVWAFRPGSTRIYSDTAEIPFRHEKTPQSPAEKGHGKASIEEVEK